MASRGCVQGMMGLGPGVSPAGARGAANSYEQLLLAQQQQQQQQAVAAAQAQAAGRAGGAAGSGTGIPCPGLAPSPLVCKSTWEDSSRIRWL